MLALAPLLLAALTPARVLADDAAAAFARGTRHFEARDYLAAIAAFESAYKLRPHHAVQCSIARCYENLLKPVEAAEHYRRCLTEGADRSSIAKRIRTSLAEVEKKITFVDVLSPKAVGTIFVDGAPAGVTPKRIALNPGRHILEVRREGARPATATLTTLGGEQKTVVLEPTSGSSAPHSAPVPPAVRRGPSPPLVVAAAEPPARPRRRLHPAGFWTAAGVSVALAGSAIALGALTLKKQSAYNEHPTKEALDSFKSMRLATNVLWGVAAAAAGTGTVLFFFTDFRGEARRSSVAGAGLGIGGVF